MLVHAGCWHRPRTDGFVFFKHEDTGGGPGLVEKGAVASWAALFHPSLAPRTALPQGGGRREEGNPRPKALASSAAVVSVAKSDGSADVAKSDVTSLNAG